MNDFRLVSRDGAASPAELLRDQDAMMRKHRDESGAAESTVEALMFSLRSRGIAALDEAPTQRRLSDLSKSQVGEVIARLRSIQGKYPAICGRLIVKLGGIYGAL